MDFLRKPICRLTLALAGLVLTAVSTRAGPPPDADLDAHNLVLLAPGHPMFLQLRVQVDGRGLKSVRTAYAAKLFGQFDKDGDRLLDREEAKAIPPLVKSASATETVAIADRWEAVDVNPADDKVSLEELGAYIDRVFGSTFLLSIKPLRATQSIDLFPLLDLNRDGRLSREELQAAPQVLHKLDLDDDETYSVDELQPFRNPQIPLVPAVPANQSTDQPFLLLDDAESISRAAEQLQQRYRGSEAPAGPVRMRRESLGLDEADFAPHDADADGTFDSDELAAFLRNPVPQLVIHAELPQLKPGRPKLTVVKDRLGAEGGKKTAGSDKLALTLTGLGVELQAATVKALRDARDNRDFYKTQFLQADRDKNKYLSEEEFSALRLANVDFKSVDRNGDGMILIDEVLAYVEQESASSQSRIELSISHDGKSVFEVIDANLDRRISRRELVHAADRLQSYDRDGDGAITAVELAGRFRGTLEFGRPVLFRGPSGMGRADVTTPIVNAPTAGPDWFRRMDRNRDGDVSLREFLGPLAAFRKLDADGDGLISAVEADKAGTHAALK